MKRWVQFTIEWFWRLCGYPTVHERREQLASAIYRDLREQRQGFRLETTVGRYDMSGEDIQNACQLVYIRLLSVVWKDGYVDDSEKRLLARVAEMIKLTPGTANKLNFEAAKERFGKAFDKAMADGVIEDFEEEYLYHVATVAGFDDYNLFVEMHFYEQSEAGIAAAKAEADEKARLEAIRRAEREAEEAARRRRQAAARPVRLYASRTYVRGYYRKDGTYVQPHSRRR